MESRSKKLRSGYTTGACAAAAAKAAAMLLLKTMASVKAPERQSAEESDTLTLCRADTIEIPFPDGSRVSFPVHASSVTDTAPGTAHASVIKDAGDDPDVTNGAEIVATVRIINSQNSLHSTLSAQHSPLLIKGGKGVGRVTKPGLSNPVGEPAINPVPRKMIEEAVKEALDQAEPSAFSLQPSALEITISVPLGEELAKKTLNSRLGIIGGISILGTTGIVRPLSTDAWTASISASMDVARAMGCDEVVISAGRTSERAHMKKFRLPEEAYVMMGDYLEFSLSDAKRHDFRKIHLCAQWAKMLKIALSTPQTHVRHGAIDVRKAVELLNSLGIPVPREREFNTAREIFDFLVNATPDTQQTTFFSRVCAAARQYAEGIAGVPVAAHLVSYGGDIIAASE